MTWQQLLHFRCPFRGLLYHEVSLVVPRSEVWFQYGLKSDNLWCLSYDALLCPSKQRCNTALLCLKWHQLPSSITETNGLAMCRMSFYIQQLHW